jgi:hypothetical protein
MGMYDELRCEYPLPVEGANQLLFQTKDTPSQYLDLYVIKADGSLWHETYDTEDRSDPNATGLEAIFGCATRVNQRLCQVTDFTGEIQFYGTSVDGKWTPENWTEFSAYFVGGSLKHLEVIKAPERHAQAASGVDARAAGAQPSDAAK